jgi:hypothetical protein
MHNMILFVGFYGTAIARRHQPDIRLPMAGKAAGDTVSTIMALFARRSEASTDPMAGGEGDR